MTSPTLLDKNQFLNEVKQWAADGKTLHKVRAMKTAEDIRLRFYIPQTTEIIETRIPIQEFTDFDRLNFASISVPSFWEVDNDLTKNIIKKLEELNGPTSITNTNRGVRFIGRLPRT